MPDSHCVVLIHKTWSWQLDTTPLSGCTCGVPAVCHVCQCPGGFFRVRYRPLWHNPGHFHRISPQMSLSWVQVALPFHAHKSEGSPPHTLSTVEPLHHPHKESHCHTTSSCQRLSHLYALFCHRPSWCIFLNFSTNTWLAAWKSRSCINFIWINWARSGCLSGSCGNIPYHQCLEHKHRNVEFSTPTQAPLSLKLRISPLMHEPLWNKTISIITHWHATKLFSSFKITCESYLSLIDLWLISNNNVHYAPVPSILLELMLTSNKKSTQNLDTYIYFCKTFFLFLAFIFPWINRSL